MIDLKNKRFGRLTVMRIVGKIRSYKLWECRCDCGNIKNVQSSLLIGNSVKSCGCLRKEKSSNRCIERNKPRIIPIETYKNRLLRKVEMLPECGCWIWTGPMKEGRYGAFFINNRRERTHRASWIIHNGSIPDGLCVCHSCDTPECINPKHLFLGTMKENAQDMVSKKRAKKLFIRGEKHLLSKLKEYQVMKIYNSSELNSKLANKYDVSNSTIQSIKSGRNWSHITRSNNHNIILSHE